MVALTCLFWFTVLALCVEPRYAGDSGCDYLGVYADDAAARIREIVR